jgi:hypothetical protein
MADCVQREVSKKPRNEIGMNAQLVQGQLFTTPGRDSLVSANSYRGGILIQATDQDKCRFSSHAHQSLGVQPFAFLQ